MRVMLSVWWGVKWLIHWEFLPTDRTITADLYIQQLDRVAAKLRGKQDKVYFLHDNARPHIAKSTREKLLELGWTVLSHPPYSPDLAPTDYKLFRSLENYLDKKNSTTNKRSAWQLEISSIKSHRSSMSMGSFLFQNARDKS